MSDATVPSAASVRAAATEILTRCGYELITNLSFDRWPASEVQMVEDSYGIVAIVVYETWGELVSSWSEAQAALVDIISRYVNRTDAKSWDGYLILATAARSGIGQDADVRRIRYDTTRLRKIVITGDDLRTLADLERLLMPLLPFNEVEVGSPASALEMLPELLERNGIPREATRDAVQAFLEQDPILERLHHSRRAK